MQLPKPVPAYRDLYRAAPDRYNRMSFRRCGTSGLQLPAVSLGLWRNCGDNQPFDRLRAVFRTAFDAGITHFDLGNNYGIPFGSAETNFGRMLREDFRPYRDEILISTKAGWDMWPGPYGNWGSRKYLLASLDQSLLRLGIDYVDIFYSHRADPHTPLEETMSALHSAVEQGKALYVGVSMYSPDRTRRAASILRSAGTPLAAHQASYSMLNRWIEGGLLDVLREEGAGCIGFSPLAQGMLSDKYLEGIPAGSRASENRSLSQTFLSAENLEKTRELAVVAAGRGQTLPQLALAWALRNPTVASVVVGFSRLDQLEENMKALGNLEFSADELAAIDRYATESGVNIWSSSLQE